MWISKGGLSQVLLSKQDLPDLAGIRTYDPVNVDLNLPLPLCYPAGIGMR